MTRGYRWQDGEQAFADWFQHYHQKPRQPEQTSAGQSFTDKVAGEHRMKQYEQELRRWENALSVTTQVSIYVVLPTYAGVPGRVFLGTWEFGKSLSPAYSAQW